jgi:hypothetical protein
LGLGKSSIRVMPSVGSGRYSPGLGMVCLLEELYQVIRKPLPICSLFRPGNLAIDSTSFEYLFVKVVETGRIMVPQDDLALHFLVIFA